MKFLIQISAILHILLSGDRTCFRRLTLCFGQVDIFEGEIIDCDDNFSSLLRKLIETSDHLERVDVFVLVKRKPNNLIVLSATQVVTRCYTRSLHKLLHTQLHNLLHNCQLRKMNRKYFSK